MDVDADDIIYTPTIKRMTCEIDRRLGLGVQQVGLYIITGTNALMFTN